MHWNTERTSALIDLWNAGRSATEIANTLGKTTRNAVIGKVYRLKLPQRAPRALARRRKSSAVPLPPRTSKTDRGPADIPELGPPPPFHPKIHSLAPHHCRWPEGDPRTPEFHFCGRPAVPDKPYCPHHAAHTYERRRRRRKKTEPQQTSH